MQQFKVCVVGAGYWGKNHISTLDQIGVLGGIVDTSEKQLNFSHKNYQKLSVIKMLKMLCKIQNFQVLHLLLLLKLTMSWQKV